MTSFSAAELACMQTTQEAAMMDTCDLLVRDETDRADEYGMPVANWVIQATVACGLDMRPSQEARNAEAKLFDARLRLPIETDFSQVDRVRITHRFGVMLEAPLEYEIIGQAQRGPSGLRVELRGVV